LKAVFNNPLSDEENEHIRRLYAADIKQTDMGVQSLIRQLRSRRGDNWVVVITADHGESLGEHDFFYDHGDYAYQAALRVPLAFIDLREPLSEARSVDGWVSLVDVAPTMADWLDWSWPEENTVDGRSLVSVLEGGDVEHQPVFAECGQSFFESEIKRRVTFDVAGRFRAAMSGDRKVIYTPGMDDDDAWELYDLANDPKETTNRWEDDSEEPEVKALVAALRDWMSKDPLAGDGVKPTAADVELLKSLGYME
jgi:arylsulfatase A-like enzyme